ncbi:unnamed protein product [Calicophoron daubneyi]|uniref:DEP domain-containing protein n=1 Tax=Calicophoron daubneyi TaxID=300641 RepID=A0AAV2SZR7_CALDB
MPPPRRSSDYLVKGSHGISPGDVIEVYHPGEMHHALFLVTALRDDLPTRDIISIEHSLANTFKFQQHKSVCVRVVTKESVVLDLAELHFRDQYFSHSDCYRFTEELVGNVVQVNKKVEYNDMWAQVGELWRKGERYSCGFVGPKTKIIFRSSTAVIHVFIQLSHEMWQFDEHGDLYFEKALKFLTKLFLRLWPENNCNHDTTVVFFTRIYIEDLPPVCQGRVNRDANGRCFEDFYRVLVQNERLTTDEWKRVLAQLRLQFRTFQKDLFLYLQLRYSSSTAEFSPRLRISSAADGNLLETLNMTVNLYSGYNIDCNLDRTGKTTFVISPSCGCYQADRNLLNLTKQRILDLGIAIDLICLGEQPLHTVPLFIVPNAKTNEYVVPNWINCSFFRSAHQLQRIGLGLPVNRVQVVPNYIRFSSSGDMDNTILNQPNEQERNSSEHPGLPPNPVYRIIYPPSDRRPGEDLFATRDSFGRTSSASEEERPDATLLNASGGEQSSSLESTKLSGISSNPVATAINTAKALASGHRADQPRQHRSESDASPSEGTEWDQERENLNSIRGGLGRGAARSSSRNILATTCSSHSTSVVASLPSVREGRMEQMRSVRMAAGPLQNRRTIGCSDFDPRFCVVGSADSTICRVTVRPPLLSSKSIPWALPRPLSFGGPNRNSVGRIHSLSGSACQSNPHPILDRRGYSHSTTTFKIAARGQGRRSEMLGCRSRRSSSQSQSPFEFIMETDDFSDSSGQRRWALVRPPDEFGIPIPPHRTHSPLRTTEFLKPVGPAVNLSEVWMAYFNYVRVRRNHSAPGGPTAPSVRPELLIPLNDSCLDGFHGFHTSSRRSGQFFTDRTMSTATLRGLRPLVRDELQSVVRRSLCDSNSLQRGSWFNSFERTRRSPTATTTHPLSCTSGLDSDNLITSTSEKVDSAITAVQRLVSAMQGVGEKPAWGHLNMDKQLLSPRMGVDWKSVSTPACLPLETDFFPDSASLNSEGYTLHDYRVVPFGVNPDEWVSTHNFEHTPGLFYCRRPMTVREVFHEMILQRLCHGFQIYHELSSSTVPVPVQSEHHSVSVVTSPISVTNSPKISKLNNKPTPRPRERLERKARTGSAMSLSLRLPSRRDSDGGVAQTKSSLRRRNVNSSHGGTSPTKDKPSVPVAQPIRTLGIGLSNVGSARSTNLPLKGAPLQLGRCGRPESPTRFSLQPGGWETGPDSFPYKIVYKMSIGQIFHTLSLEGDSITLTNYRLRRTEEPVQWEYSYALQVPDAEAFLSLKTVFTDEGTTALNWSYLDNYLCTRGVSDSFVLLPTLKFWRSRFLLVPNYTNETKRLSEAIKESLHTNGPRVRCDVYEADYCAMDQAKICEKFVHFIESISRVRRCPARKMPLRQPTTDRSESAYRSRDVSGFVSATPGLTGAPSTETLSNAPKSRLTDVSSHSSFTVSSSVSSNPISNMIFQRLLNNSAQSTAQSGTSFETPLSTVHTSASPFPADDSQPGTTFTLTSDSPVHSTDNVLGGGQSGGTANVGAHGSSTGVAGLINSATTPVSSVALLMMDADIGLPFVTSSTTGAFPEHTFLSFDAVVWVMKWISDITTVQAAVDYLQMLLESGWIRHTSGNQAHRFVFGCYFYTLLAPDLKAYGFSDTSSPVILGSDSAQTIPPTPTFVTVPGVTVGGNVLSVQLPGAAIGSTTSQSTISLNTLNVKNKSCDSPASGTLVPQPAVVQPIPFPESFQPKATPGPTGWTLDFQTEWAEVTTAHQAFMGYAHPLSCSPSSLLYPKSADERNLSTAEAEVCLSASVDGFLTYATISSVCGVHGKMGYQETSEGVLRKSCICDLEGSTVDDRAEWAHFVYDANYHPHCAFTLELQWLVASGAKLSDLVTQWRHRATNSNFHFFPVPCFPFGHSSTVRSDADPLRAPLFIPINVQSLVRLVPGDVNPSVSTNQTLRSSCTLSSPFHCSSESESKTEVDWHVPDVIHTLFAEFPRSCRITLLRMFQDYLLRRFGFLRDVYNSSQMNFELEGLHGVDPTQQNKRWAYFHCSGGMFIMIPSYRTEHAQATSTNSERSLLTTPDTASPSPVENTSRASDAATSLLSASLRSQKPYDQRSLGGKPDGCFCARLEPGYYWSWNHMLPRRWRGYLTGDESFQDAVLADLRAFMRGDDERLAQAFVHFSTTMRTALQTAGTPEGNSQQGLIPKTDNS